MKIFDELDKEYDQSVIDKKSLEVEKNKLLIEKEFLIIDSMSKELCSTVLSYDVDMPMIAELRSNCIKEHSRNLELEAKILKKQQMYDEEVKHVGYLEKQHIEKLKIQISNMKEMRAGPKVNNLDAQALETKNSQLKEELTDVRVKHDVFRVENVNIKKCYQELYNSSTYSHAQFTKMIISLTIKNANLKAELKGNMNSGPAVPEKPKVHAPGMFAINPKYVPPQKINNRDANTYLPRKQQVTSPKPNKMSNINILKHVEQQHKKLNVPVNLSTRAKSTTETSKSKSKSDIRTHRILPARSEKARTIEDHLRNLNKRIMFSEKPLTSYKHKDRKATSNGISTTVAVQVVNDPVNSMRSSHPLKTVNTNIEILNTLHMDLCGPVRIESLNGKKYILVIVDDYTRFGWVRFLRTKDETPEVIKKFIVLTQRSLNATVRYVRTDNGTEFVNKTLTEFFESVGISHNASVPWTPQQNGVVKKQNQTLMKAARKETKIEFGSLCYPTNDNDDLGKLKAKADIGTMLHNVEQLEKQLDKEDFQEIGSMDAINVLETQFQMFITSRVYLNDEYVAMTRNYFIQYPQQAIPEFRDTLIQHLESVKKSIDERAQHKIKYDRWVNERHMQTTEEKVDTSKALDASKSSFATTKTVPIA
nr:hypothetical protein [Tanacetum cinerariifolium]